MAPAIHLVWLITGSNLGDRYVNCLHARGLIEAKIGRIRMQSSVYETDPWGISGQPEFFNQVIVCETMLSPEEVLAKIDQIEQSGGRKRGGEKYGPRMIDVDILFYDDLVMESESLLIPHPKIAERRFALAPLMEIAPDHIHPLLGKSMLELLMQCTDPCQVRKLDANQ